MQQRIAEPYHADARDERRQPRRDADPNSAKHESGDHGEHPGVGDDAAGHNQHGVPLHPRDAAGQFGPCERHLLPDERRRLPRQFGQQFTNRALCQPLCPYVPPRGCCDDTARVRAE